MTALTGRTVLGRYRVLQLLARGGMGEVYLARSEGAAGFHRPVVVKRVLAQHADDRVIVGLFQREARVMSSLRHPNIVSVLDFGEEKGDHVMVIEYVHGFHLGRWQRWLASRNEPFPAERAITIMLAVLDALEHAHGARGPDGTGLGVVHRDVSPGNVLVDVEGTVKLADFGIAKIDGEHTIVEGSQPSVKGKFPYLPPEIFDGTPATVATDVYAVGVVLDEILRGRNAFRAAQMAETISRVLEHVPARLDTLRSDVGPELASVVARSIAKDPAARYPTAAALGEALRAVRKSTTDDARAELSSAARRDFRDPAMAETLELPPLSQLEALWHGPPPPLTEDLENDRTSIATVPGRRGAGKAEPGRRGLVAAGVGVVVLAAAGVGGSFAFLRPPPLEAGGPVFVVVDHTATDAGATTSTAPDAPEIVPDAGAETDDEPRPTVRAAARSIEAPFRARAGEISRCFAAHVDSVEGAPELEVHFRVAADGTVERATLEPEAIADTELGRCILGLARSTHFVTDAAVSFHVPLGARRGGR